MCWKLHWRPPASTVPVPSGPPVGKSGDVTEAVPISNVAVSWSVTVAVIRPALVRTEKPPPALVQLARSRYSTACLTPLPESSASDPSGLKI